VLIQFWGVRGSISAPGPQTIRYGGNTPCLQVTSETGESFIVDAGYGAVGLGEAIMAKRPTKDLTVHLVLTHLHWDHIQGLPFFLPIYIPGTRLVIHSVSAKTAKEALERLFTSIYSPIKGVENLGAAIEYEEISEGGSLCGISIDPVILDHVVPTLGLRMSEGDAVACHATDHEGGDPSCDARLVEVARGAELLIHDAQFTEEEYRRYKGWGHSHTGSAVANALAAGASRLALFHYDPTHTDHEVDRQLARARELAQDTELEVLAAAEGLSVKI
jgi:phosphoribosyl 1,2-cyclic phosphodiesterase